MLDTNIAIALRDGDAVTEAKLLLLGNDLCLSVITRIELEGGLAGDSPDARVRRLRLQHILGAVPVVALDEDAVAAYARIIATTGFSRRKILDRMIAAQAIMQGATLVTRNGADFDDVPDLKLLAW